MPLKNIRTREEIEGQLQYSFYTEQNAVNQEPVVLKDSETFFYNSTDKTARVNLRPEKTVIVESRLMELEQQFPNPTEEQLNAMLHLSKLESYTVAENSLLHHQLTGKLCRFKIGSRVASRYVANTNKRVLSQTGEAMQILGIAGDEIEMPTIVAPEAVPLVAAGKFGRKTQNPGGSAFKFETPAVVNNNVDDDFDVAEVHTMETLRNVSTDELKALLKAAAKGVIKGANNKMDKEATLAQLVGQPISQDVPF